MAAIIQVEHANSSLNVFLFCFCVVCLSQVDGSLLDSALIGTELQKFARDALGVDEMQVYLRGLQYHKRTIKGDDITPSLAVKLADKFKTRFEVATRLKRAVEASYARAAKPKPAVECCKADKSKLQYDVRFRSKVDLNNICLKISGTASSNPFLLDEQVFTEMKQISQAYPFIKWQYFGSEEGVLTNFPLYDDKEDCPKYDPRYRPFYVETATPETKDVVLVIDTSDSMIGKKLTIAREAANSVLETLNPKDRVGIVSFSTQARTPQESKCYSERLALAIPANIRRLKNYLGQLYPRGQTQYRLAFEKAFDLLKGSISDDGGKPKKRVILFLTDDAPSDAKRELIFQTIRDRNLELNNSVIILTFGFGGVNSETEQILLDIATQNTDKHGFPANTSVGDITTGKYTHVGDINTLRSKMATYYDMFTSYRRLNRPVVSVPYVDAFGTGLLMSITLPCYDKNKKFIGVTGTDINIEDLTADISLFNQGRSTYAFMTSRSGRSIVHPLLPAPTNPYGYPVYLDIRALEPELEFNDVFASMTMGEFGSKTFVAKRFLPRGGNEKEGVIVTNVNSTYFWTQLEGTDFSLCVVVPVSHIHDELNTLPIPKEGYNFKYHRIDLYPPKKPCSHFGNYAAKDTTVVKFAPGAFTDPYKYIGKDERKADVELLNAYMNDKTGTVRNPGLKMGIRDTVIATWKVEDLWLRDKTELTQYLVWRYVGTSNGVFRTTPGGIEEKSYDPRQRPWYYTALGNSGLITLTTPYLDVGGAGVVITAARSLYLGESSQIHHTNDDVLGVMGADFPLTYFSRLLTKVYPKCRERQTYSCFVMDGAGFLIMHEKFFEPDAKASDVQYVHITQKENYIAEHLIINGYLIKKECRNLKEIQKQSFYEVRLPPGGVNNLESSDSCSKYQLEKIMGTNAYLGVAFRGSDFSHCVAKSCICTSDKKCSTPSPKCECPCTSSLSDFNYCLSQFPNSSLPICPPSAPEIQLPSDPSPPVPKKKCDDDKSRLEKCFDPNCREKNTSQTCEGIASCYWCELNKDGVPLKKRYCASSEVCFRGKEAEQPNCAVSVTPSSKPSSKSPLRGENWISRLSKGTLAGFVGGCTAAVALMVAALIMVIRRCRNTGSPSIDKNTSVSTVQIIDSESPSMSNRPPAPLPDHLPVEYIIDANYEDPDALERSQEGSVAFLQWPSPYDEIQVRTRTIPPSIPLDERRPSDGLTHVIPRPASLPRSDKRPEPYVGTQPPLPQARKISAGNTPPGNLPHSPVTRTESHEGERPPLPQPRKTSESNTSTGNPSHPPARRATSHGVGQPQLPKARKASDGYPSQSVLRSAGQPPQLPLRKISVIDQPPLDQLRKISGCDQLPPNTHTTTQCIDEEPLELPGKQRSSVVSGSVSLPIVISRDQETSTSDNPLYTTERNRASQDDEASSSSVSFQKADRPAYCNLPPPLPEPRKDSDGYMVPFTGQSRLKPNDSFTSVDSHGYLKCFV